MWYKNIAGRFFELVTKHACNRQTDGRTDGRTDRITTPKTALVKLRRAVKMSDMVGTAVLSQKPRRLHRFRNDSSFARSDAEQRPDHAGRFQRDSTSRFTKKYESFQHNDSNFRPHRSITYVDAAYRYRGSVVCHDHEPCKNC